MDNFENFWFKNSTFLTASVDADIPAQKMLKQAKRVVRERERENKEKEQERQPRSSPLSELPELMFPGIPSLYGGC